MKRISLLFGFAIVLGSTAPTVEAIDHKNLDENRPLRLEDAYAIAHGEWVIEAGAAFAVERRSSDRFIFPIEVLYGPFLNTQISLGSALSTEPRAIDEQTKSGDLSLTGLYNFNQETLTLPAFGLKTSLNLPTGVRSSGVDFQLKGLLTKSFRRLSTHFNAAYNFLNGIKSGERDGRYEFVAGASYPIGAPQYTRTTLVGDLFTEQSVRSGGSNIFGAEIGLRHQLTARTVLDFGVGSEFAGPSERSPFYVTGGFAFGF
jgi:hypothetical protein